jgi:hypothetical protein
VYIVLRPEHAGHAMHTLFVDDLDALVERLADWGLDPVERETYTGGVRKITYRDPTETRSDWAALHCNRLPAKAAEGAGDMFTTRSVSNRSLDQQLPLHTCHLVLTRGTS